MEGIEFGDCEGFCRVLRLDSTRDDLSGRNKMKTEVRVEDKQNIISFK